jgi:hypothetical protein
LNGAPPNKPLKQTAALVVTTTASLSPVVKYHGLGHRYLPRRDLLMRPLLNGGTLIWNDGSSSKGGFSSFLDLSLLSFLKI